MGNGQFDTSEFIDSFIEVGEERLLTIEKGFLRLEKEGLDPSLLKEILREAHTLKGEARMMGLDEIGEEAHSLEDLLVELRNSGRDAASVADGLFGKIKSLGDLVAGLGKNDEESEPNGPQADSGGAMDETAKVKKEAVRVKNETIRVKKDLLEKISNLSIEVVSAFRQIEINNSNLRRLSRKSQEIRKKWNEIRRTVLEKAGKDRGEALNEFHSDLMLLFDTMRLAWSGYESIVELHSNAIEELLSESISSRMRSLSQIFDVYPGQVRSIANELGKMVDFSVEGGDIELDKSIIEALNEPIVHMLRNSLDHGIEKPQLREKKGKPREGRMWLRALRKGQSVVIELEDDGNGLDIGRIREGALKKGIILPQDDANGPGGDEVPKGILDCISSSGFTTKTSVSSISGRGVGMEAVKTTVEKFGGSLQIFSRPNQGLRLVLEFPHTIVFMPVLLVRAAAQCFGVPTQWVDGVMKINRREIGQLEGRGQIRVNDSLVPLVDLSQAIGFSPAPLEEEDTFLSIAVSKKGRNCVFRIEELIDQRDVIVKPLPGYIKTNLVIGATILEDGNATPILNIQELMNTSNMEAWTPPETLAPKKRREKVRVLAVDDAIITRSLLRNVLLSAGYEVTIATNGAEALEKLSGAMFDIVLSDVEMPVMDGIELTERLKVHKKFKDIPVVIISSHESSKDKKRGLEAGADAYLAKSIFSQKMLVETIERLTALQ
jgi:two-component system chemotaxis sensor kinase CheA